MEPAHIELGPKRLLYLVAQFADRQPSYHVRGGLAGVDDIALDSLQDAAGAVG